LLLIELHAAIFTTISVDRHRLPRMPEGISSGTA
jgi:hypothetical protein